MPILTPAPSHLPEFLLSRDGSARGDVIGTRRCRMEGCLGTALIVRWPDKKRTYPCTKAIEETSTLNTWKLS
jgi:hypothetical protein